MVSDWLQIRKLLGAGALLLLAVLAGLAAISGGDATQVAFVRTENELHSAVWDAGVTDIVLLADVRIRNTQLWSRHLVTNTSPSRGPSPPPIWASQPGPSNRPVLIGRQLRIRGDTAGIYKASESYSSPTPPVSDAASRAAAAATAAPALNSDNATSFLRLPLLDLTAITGWLRVLPNASLTLQGLHLTSALSTAQPDLQPYRALLRALLSAPPLTAVNPEGQRLLAVSLEGCVESVDVGLPQSLGEAAVRALPPLPGAVAAAAAAVAVSGTSATSAGAWAAVPLPPAVPVELKPVAAQLCVISGSNNNSTSSSNGSGGNTQHLSKLFQSRRRAHATRPDQGTGRGAVGAPDPGPFTEALCWLVELVPSQGALRALALALAAVGLPRCRPGQHAHGDAPCASWQEPETPDPLPRRPQNWSGGRGSGYASGDGAGTAITGERAGIGSGCDEAWAVGHGDVHVGRMALSKSTQDAPIIAEPGGVCLGGDVLVGRAVTAMAFPVAEAHGSGSLLAVTDDFLATADGWANLTGNSSADYSSSPPTPPVLLLLMVADTYSASTAQVDEACLRSAGATLAACVQRAMTAALRSGAAPPPFPAPSVPPLPPPAMLPAAREENHGTAFQVALWVVLAVTAVLLCALGVLLLQYRRLRRRHNRERGAQRAPGVGPMTTLLITDIANSTGLWESLPEEVMDQALKLHHACLRALLQRFNGYESATEGDSFILAFHVPPDAAKFALSAQVQLMDVMWPAEVLAHPDGQEVWVVPRSADMPHAGALQQHLSHSLGASLSIDVVAGVGAAGHGASMSVQRSSGGGTMVGGAPQRASDVGYTGYGGGASTTTAAAAGGGAVAAGGGGGFLRSSRTRPKSFKAAGPPGLRPGGLLPPGVTRSMELDRLSASELDTDDMTYREEGRTGSGMLRSFTSRMTTMLGLAPPGGGGGLAAGASSRPSSRIGRFLRISASVVRGASHEDYRPQSFVDRPALGRLPASGSQRHGGLGSGGGAGGGVAASGAAGGVEMSRRAMRSKSFGGRLLAGRTAQPSPRLGATAGPNSGSGHGVAAITGGMAPSSATPTGSFTSGARSLLRQALSFNRRHGSFRGLSRAAAEAAAAETAPTAAGAAAAAGATPVTTTATIVTASSTGFSASVGSPGGSRCMGSYKNLPTYAPAYGDASPAPAEGAAATRRVTAEGAPLFSREVSVGSVTGACGNSVSGSGKGSMFRNGMLRLGCGGVGGAGSSGHGNGRGGGQSSSGILRISLGGATLAAAAAVTSGPTAMALTMSSDGRHRRSINVSGTGTSPSADPAGRTAQQDAANRAAISSVPGGYQRRRHAHMHSLYGDCVAGVAYGRSSMVHMRLRSSYDGSLAAGALVAVDETAMATAAAAATAESATVDIAGRGCSTSQANAFAESEATTTALFTSIIAGSSGAATDDGQGGRRLSNATATLVMDVFKSGGAGGLGGGRAAGQQVAPRVPQFRSALVFEGVRGDGGGLSMAALQKAYIRRSSAPADVGGGSGAPALMAVAAAVDVASTPPVTQPIALEAGDAASAVGCGGNILAVAAARGCDAGPAADSGGIGRFNGSRNNVAGGGGGGVMTVLSTGGVQQGGELASLARRLRGGAAAWHQPSTAAAAAVRPPMVVTHNQLYGTQDDLDTHVQLGSGELRVSDCLRLVSQEMVLVPSDACEAVMGGIEEDPDPDAGGTAAIAVAVGAAKVEATLNTEHMAAEMEGEGADVADARAAAASAAPGGGGSSPLAASLGVANTGSGREGHETASTTVGGSESIGLTSSGGHGGPRSLVTLPSRVVPSLGFVSPTSNSGGGAVTGSGSLSATLARMMRRGRDGRGQSSPTVRSSFLDSAEAGSTGSGGSAPPRVGALAPIREPDDGATPLPLQPQPRRNVCASGIGTAIGSSSLLRAASTAAHAGGGGSSSAGQLPALGSVVVGVGALVGSGSQHRGSGGGASASTVAAGLSPLASRTGSVTMSSVSQTVARGLSRAHTLARQLTRDRSVSRAARRSVGNTGSLDFSIGGAVAGSGGSVGGGRGATGLPNSGGLLVAASAILGASDAEGDSGAELSAIGILADGMRARMAAGSVSASDRVSKLQAAVMGAGSGDGALAVAGEADGEGQHRLSARMVTVDLGAALAAVDKDFGDPPALPPAPASAKSPADLRPPPLPLLLPLPHDRDPRSAARLSAAQLLTTSPGAGGTGNGGVGGGNGGAGGGGAGARGGNSRAFTAGAGAYGAASAPPLRPRGSAATTALAFSGAASRRISFLGLGLVQRSRTAERRSSATEEWQGSHGDMTGPYQGALASQTAPTSQLLSPVGAECRSWREKCKEDWPPAIRPAPPARCAYRGLRVRMGLHTGITTASDVTFNPTTSHMAYGGTAMKVAKAVGDAAAGGMILMSQSTFQALVSAMMELPGAPQAVFSGESTLGLDLGPDSAHHSVCLYQLVHRELVQRIGYAAPLRNIPLTQLGTEDAPTGFCAISFMHVASASMLVAELGQPGVEALQQFKSIATELCSRCGGYVVEASEGLCLAAFRHAAAALVWALASREALANHPWSVEVRRWYRFALANSVHATSRGGRGPRPRTGVHVGGVNVEVNAATGRMTYRGKVMNRTSRIAHKATSEQIVCSKEAWDAVEASLQRVVAEIKEERRRAEEALREAAAAARAGSSTAEGEAEGEGEGYDDMLSELSPTATPSMRRAPSGVGHLAAAAVTSKHGSPPSSRGKAGRSGSGGSKPGSAPSSARSALGQTAQQHGEGATSDGSLPRYKPTSLAASLAASVRAHRSASAKHLSAAAAAAAALSRRVTSFTARLSSTSLPDMSPSAAALITAPSASIGPGSIRAAGAAADVARSPPSAPPPTAARMVPAAGAAPPGSVPQLAVGISPTGLPPAPPLGPTASLLAFTGSVAATTADVPSPGGATLACLPSAADPSAAGQGTCGGASGPGPTAAPAAGTGTAKAETVAGSPRSSEPPQPSLQWQALNRLVGPKVQLPSAKRLDARFLGSYSLKGVREEMKLLEVFWAEEEAMDDEESIAAGGGEGSENNDRATCEAGGGSIGRTGSTTAKRGSGAPSFVNNAISSLEAVRMEASPAGAGVVPSTARAVSQEGWAVAAAAGFGGMALPRMVAAPERTGPLPFTIANAAQLGPDIRGGGSGGAAATTAGCAAGSVAVAIAVEGQPVSLSTADIWQPRGAKSDWPPTDTVGSMYEDDIAGSILPPADVIEGLAPAAMTSFRDETALPTAAAIGRELRDGDMDRNGGGGGGSGRSQRGSSGTVVGARVPPPAPPQPLPPPRLFRTVSAASPVPIPVPGGQPPSLHHLSPYGGVLPHSQQYPLQHYRHPQPQPRPRSSLRPEWLMGGSAHNPYRSPSPGTSPGPSPSGACVSSGVGPDASTSSSGNRRRHLAVGVTFVDLPFLAQQPPASTPVPAHAPAATSASQHSLRIGLRARQRLGSVPVEPQGAAGGPHGGRDIEHEPEPGAGAVAGAVAGAGADLRQGTAIRSVAAAAMIQQRPLSAPMPVRSRQPPPVAAADWGAGQSPQQPAAAWATDVPEIGGLQGPRLAQGGLSAGPQGSVEEPSLGLPPTTAVTEELQRKHRVVMAAAAEEEEEEEERSSAAPAVGAQQRHAWEAAVPSSGSGGTGPALVDIMKMRTSGLLQLPPPEATAGLTSTQEIEETAEDASAPEFRP